MITLPKTVSLLNWSVAESQECNAQGLITNGTDHVWLSCTSYIAHGRIQFAEDHVPVGLTLDKFNYDALTGPSNKTGNIYGHISDGDFFHRKKGNDGHDELWFGIEGMDLPRVVPGAIARYDAETLEFIDIHPHPFLMTMPFVVVDSKREQAYSSNWTGSMNQFNIFDATTSNWTLDTNLTISEVPPAYEATGISYIHGGAMASNDYFILQVDDADSTLLYVHVMKDDDGGLMTGVVEDTWPTGLGHEREGISLAGRYILSFGNRRGSWGVNGTAQIVAVEALPGLVEAGIPFGAGIVIGILMVVVMRLLCWCCCRVCSNMSGKEYEQTEMANLAVNKDPGNDDELI